MSDKILVRYGNKSDLPTLDSREPGLATDTNEFFIGTPEGNMLVNNTTNNYLSNGNFDIAQRGTSFANPVTGEFTLDRCNITNGSDSGTFPTVTHSQISLTAGDLANSFYGYRVNVNGAGTSLGINSFYWMRQKMENLVRYICGAGKKVTISFWAKSDIVGKKIGVHLQQAYGTGGSPSSTENIVGTNWTLTSGWTKYSCSFTTNTLVGKTFGTNNDDFLTLNFMYQWGVSFASRAGDTVAETFVGSGNIDITQVQVCIGDAALPFQPNVTGDEVKKCLRYTWIPQTNSVYVRLSTYTANTLVFDVSLPIQLRTNPSVRGTVNTDIIAYTVAGVAQTGFTASPTLTSNGVRVTMTKVGHGLTDAYLEIKTTGGFGAEL